MKTIPVSLILAGIFCPVAVFAQPADRPEGGPPRGHGGKPGPHRSFADAWKAADQNGDGFITGEEFAQIPRILKLPDEKRDRVFKRLDKDGDGKLSRQELGRMGRPHDPKGPPMRRLWELDVDRSGGVDFQEFIQGPLFQKLTLEKQRALFRRLDTDGDGRITPKDKPKSPFRHKGPAPHNKPQDPEATKRPESRR